MMEFGEWLVVVSFSAAFLVAVASFGAAYRDPAPHMDRDAERMPWADITCGLCGKSCAAQAPTLTEAYRMIESWRSTHTCAPVSRTLTEEERARWLAES